ncbi:MAG TPA: hypothetical protein VKI65_09765 [Gemmataceae bacterium]|nr:hypothetical protein [Gemmataceae bacterium]
MRPFVGSLLAVSFVTAVAHGADRQDQLFASWEQAQREVRSLVVEFTLQTKDTIREERHKTEGTFRLIRTRNGKLFASYEAIEKKPNGDGQERWSGLLNDGAVYLLNANQKAAIRFEPVDGDLRGFLEKYFNPFVLLLDRKRADDKSKLEIVRQDEWYSYLAVNPKQVKRYGWFPDTFHQGRAVFMNKASESLPKDMPRQLWYTDGIREYTFEIKAWRLNGTDPPKLEEFAKPEDRPGWEVVEWPSKPQKK